MASKHILLVDDEPRPLHDLYRSLRPMLGSWDIRCATNALDALDLLSRRPVDAIITDLYMPAMDGLKLLRKVKELYPDTLRVIMSGHSDHESVMRVAGLAHQYLYKPCNPEAVQATVERASLLKSLLDRPAGQNGNNHMASNLQADKELTELLKRPDFSVNDAAGMIARDNTATMRLLRLFDSNRPDTDSDGDSDDPINSLTMRLTALREEDLQ